MADPSVANATILRAPTGVVPVPTPPGSVYNTPQCPCWRLTQPHTDSPTLPKFDHICIDTAKQTIRTWAERAVFHTGALYAAALPHADYIPIRDAMIAGITRQPWPYPLRESGRPLGLVLRQWVQEEPDEGLATRLENDRHWEAVRLWRATMHLNPDVEPLRLAIKVFRLKEGDVPDLDAINPSDEGIMHQLRQVGLPYTPRAVAHLRAAAEGAPRVLPARGVLLTTRAYMIWDPRVGQHIFHDGNPASDYEAPLAWNTADLMMAAYNAATAHREWLEDFSGKHPLTTSSAIHAAHPTAFKAHTDICLDYYQEAVSDTDALDKLKARVKKGVASKGSAVTEYLDTVQRRVKKRLNDRKLDGTPPEGWRERARSMIYDYIDA